MEFSSEFPFFARMLRYFKTHTFDELFGKKIYFPFLLAAYPALFLYSRNWQYFGYYDLLKPLLFLFFATLSLFIVINLAVRDGNKTSVLISVFILIFFSYGRLYELLKTSVIPAHNQLHRIILLADLAFFIIFAAIILVHRDAAALLSGYFRVFSLILIVQVSFGLSGAVLSNIHEYATRYKSHPADTGKGALKGLPSGICPIFTI